MNILFISTLMPPVRETRALVNLITHWRKEHRVTVICPIPVYWRDRLLRKKPVHPRRSRESGIPVEYFPVFKLPRLRYRIHPLLRALRKKNPAADVVVAHFRLGIRIGYHFARKTGRPLIVGLHASDLIDVSGHPRRRHALGKILSRASRVACRSRHILEKMRKYYPLESDKMFFAFSGIPRSEILSPSRLEAKIRGYRQRKVLRIVTVSSLIPRKNISAVLRALSSLPPDRWKYTVIGKGEELARLEELARNLKIHHRVQFLGQKTRPEVLRILTASDLFVLISSHESFGLAYLEALARGNLVIASVNEGMQGVIEPEKNGFLCPAGNAEQLAGILRRLTEPAFVSRLEDIWRQSIPTARRYTARGAARNYLMKINAAFGSSGR